MARIPKALLQTSNDAVPTKPVLDQLDADAVVDPVVNDALSMDVSIPDDVLTDLRARDIQDDLNIPEDEITAWHGTPNDLPPVTELVSLAHGGRVLVDKNQFPDWTKHPDLKPGDYEFVKDHPLGKFDSEKIGTGEGAQAYGHGLYFAQRKATAESYQTKLTTAKIDNEAATTTPTRSNLFTSRMPLDVESYIPISKTGIAAAKDNLKSILNSSNKSKFFASGKITNAEAFLYTRFQGVKDVKTAKTIARVEINEKIDFYQKLSEDLINPPINGPKAFLFQRSIDSLSDSFDGQITPAKINKKLNALVKLNKDVDKIDEARFSADKGSLLEVKIKAREDEFLNFDEVLDETDQANIMSLLENDKELSDFVGLTYNSFTESGYNPTGMNLLKAMEESYEPQEIAKVLSDAGIKGIKYKDAQTRFSAKGATYNYVVFDDNIISIANKYSIGLIAAGSVSLGLMTPQQAIAEVNPIGAPQPAAGTPESANNNTTDSYIEYRESIDSPELIAAKKAKAAYQAEQAKKDSFPVAVAKDIGRGIVDAPRAIVTGITSAIVETQETVNALFGKKKTISKADVFKAVLKSQTPENESITSGMVEGISQFLTGYVTAMKPLQATGKAAPFIAGAIADATVFDEHEARLSDWVEEYPEYSNFVTQYLQSDPEDSVAEGKFKLALEGLFLGGVAEVIGGAIKTVRQWKNLKKEASAEGLTPEEFVGPIKPDELTENVPSLRDEEQEFIPFDQMTEDASAVVSEPAKMGKGTAPDEAAQNINLDRLQTTDEVKELIDALAVAIPKKINDARRQTITNEETAKLADELGMTVQDLLDRRTGSAPTAEEAVAARNILVASGDNLIQLAKKAENGGDIDIALLRRAMSQHEAIQLTVSGMTAEAGRALQSFRILAASSKEQIQMIKETIESSGGMDVNQALAKRLADVGTANRKNLGKFVRKASKATTVDMITEVYVNMLLSGLPTHVINIASNASVVLNTILERKIAGVFGNEVESGEAAAQMLGVVEGAKEGFRLAKLALRTGESSDIMQKQDLQNQKAISAKNLELSGMQGQAADFLGNTVRLAGRALLASDEFFKAIAYRMELNALAYRTAAKENLSVEDFTSRVAEIIDNPPSHIKMEADAAKRYQTFTNPLGETGRKFQDLRNSDNAAAALTARLIMPFIRTPVNVVKYASARTPLAALMPSVYADFAAGGARKEVAMARIALGSSMMAVASMMSHQGIITGNGPVNYKDRQTLELSGWKPNSVLIGGVYYSIDRLDPISDILLMSANITEIMGQVDEADRIDLATAAAISTSQTLINGTFFNGLIAFFDAAASMSADPDSDNRVLNNWVSGRGTSFIPTMVGVIERKVDPTVRLTNDLTSKIKAKTPGYSEDLPPRRNIFGEQIVLEGGLGPDIMSPVYKSTKKHDPVVDEMIANKVDPGMPIWSIESVELTLEEYDRYVQLSAGVDFPRSLSQQINILIKSPLYKNSTTGRDGRKALLIEEIIMKYRKIARTRMKEEFPSLNSRILASKFQSQEALQGVAYPDAFKERAGVLPEDLIE